MADLELAPDFSFITGKNYSTIVSEYENGVEQRRARRATAIREWTLQYRNRPASEVATIQSLFTTCKGAYASFTWLNPQDSVTYTVRFKEDKLETRNHAYGFYDFDIPIIEVI